MSAVGSGKPSKALEDLYCSHAYLPATGLPMPDTKRPQQGGERPKKKKFRSVRESACDAQVHYYLTSLFFMPHAGWYPNLGEKVNRRTRNMGELCKGKGEADCWGAVRSL